jgi:hypothetical protein
VNRFWPQQYPNEVEEVISSHPGVLECAAIGIPDANSTEAVKVFVVRLDPHLTAQDIISFAGTQLTQYKVPKHVEFRSELPKSKCRQDSAPRTEERTSQKPGSCLNLWAPLPGVELSCADRTLCPPSCPRQSRCSRSLLLAHRRECSLASQSLPMTICRHGQKSSKMESKVLDVQQANLRRSTRRLIGMIGDGKSYLANGTGDATGREPVA